MKLSSDEARVLGFLAVLIALAAFARMRDQAPTFAPELAEMDVAQVEQVVDAKVEEQRRREEPLADGERIDPNTASAVELDRLPRVGAATADRIVAERERNGPFRSTAELAERVSGIGPSTVARLAPYLSLPSHSNTAPSGRPQRRQERVDVNRASATELEALPGVGPVLAARIIAWRDSAGAFRTLDDLIRVPGIGPASLERLRPHLRLGP